MEESAKTNWSSMEDCLIVWYFFCAPIGEVFDKSIVPPNVNIRDIMKRFYIIMNSPVLIERVKQSSRENIFDFKRVPFSQMEDFFLSAANKKLNKTGTVSIMKKYGNMFHPSRSHESLASRLFVLTNLKKESYVYQLNMFNQAKEFKFIANSQQNRGISQAKSLAQRNSWLSVQEKAQGLMQKGQLAVLVGRGPPLFITQHITKIGRRSQFLSVEIDLSHLHAAHVSRLHCAIFMFKDFRFYMEAIGSSVIVNGHLILKGSMCLLKSGDIIDIGGCLFMFVEKETIFTKLRMIIKK